MASRRHSKPPSIRDWDNPSRSFSYGVDYGHGAERKRVSFKTKKGKDAWIRRFLDKWQADRDLLLSFDKDKFHKFLELERQLEGHGTLEDAVKFFTTHHPQGAVPLLSEVVDMREADLKRIDGAQQKHARLYLDRFKAMAGNRPVTEYTKQDVQEWVDALVAEGKARATVKSHLGQLRTAFNLCIKDRKLKYSPVENIRLPSDRQDKRMTLITSEDLERLLQHTWEHDRKMAGLFALAFFVGLRMSILAPPPKKLKNGEFLTYDMIDRENKAIVIPGHVMKMNVDHIIDKPPECMWSWLTDIQPEHFGIGQNTFNARKRDILEELKLDWPPNLHRRSAGSYLAAVYGKEHASSLLADDSMEVFRKHYQVPAFRKGAKAYFKVVRESEGES
ncbi:MAG: tyrosine-type recombinase/integrase [Opitutaceae bacterium]